MKFALSKSSFVKPVRRACARGWIFGQNASRPARARAERAKCSLAGLTKSSLDLEFGKIKNKDCHSYLLKTESSKIRYDMYYCIRRHDIASQNYKYNI